MRQNMMKTLSNLIATLLILSATFLVAGWMQGAGKVTNINEIYPKIYSVKSPVYLNSELVGMARLKTDSTTNMSYLEAYVVEFDSYDELQTEYRLVGGDKGEVAAFTYWDEDGDCIINILSIEGWNDNQKMADLGHEAIHCMGANHIGDML